MQIKEYRVIREAGKKLGEEIFKNSTSVFKNELMSAAKLLGFWNGKILVFDAEMGMETLMDFMVFEKHTKNTAAYQRYYDSNPKLSDLEKESMDGMLNFRVSIFEIKHIDKKNSLLILKDLLDSTGKEYQLMDIGMSQTASVGYILFARLIPIRDCNMTSGMSFVFENDYKDKLMSANSLATFKKRRKLTSAELFLLVHEKNKQFGLMSGTE